MKPIQEIEAEVRRIAESEGWLPNPNRTLLGGIMEGLAVNEEKYGYQGCPCRKLSGDPQKDTDIICPCDYSAPDLAEYGRCYCALYVTREYVERGLPAAPIPERRPKEKYDAGKNPEPEKAPAPAGKEGKPVKVWRCQVCGYLCARQAPPPVCPICHSKRFEEFKYTTETRNKE